jgi:hypothetical protein
MFLASIAFLDYIVLFLCVPAGSMITRSFGCSCSAELVFNIYKDEARKMWRKSKDACNRISPCLSLRCDKCHSIRQVGEKEKGQEVKKARKGLDGCCSGKFR